MLTQMKRTGQKDSAVSQLQDAVIEFVKQFYNKPQIDSRLLLEVALASGENLVPHLLGRDYVGWKIIDIDANETVWRSSVQNKDKFLTLSATGACTVSIEVF